MRVQPGVKLGHYEFDAVIGVGGMGEVYRARDTRLGRNVAIKLLSEHLLQDASFRARLRQPRYYFRPTAKPSSTARTGECVR